MDGPAAPGFVVALGAKVDAVAVQPHSGPEGQASVKKNQMYVLLPGTDASW
jgi:hypothetical protein